MQVIELISLFLLAMIAGGWMATMIVFARGYKRLSAPAYIEVEQTNSRLACLYFAPTLVLTAVVGVIFLIVQDDLSTRAFTMSLISVILLVGTAIFVKIQVLPINAAIKKWSPQAPPANWQSIRATWVRYHNLRTVLGVTAFLLQGSAIIWR